jgi:lysozyme family protein
VIENFQTSLELVLAHEGYFGNDPRDAGGMTNLGVTKRAWQAWVKRPVDEAEMRSLTPESVAPFYKEMYWDTCKCDELPIGIDYAVFDFAVNAGTHQASKLLQEALSVDADGVIGQQTLTAVGNYGVVELTELFSEKKELFYRSLRTFATFGKGWLNRVVDVQKNVEQMTKVS